MLKIVRTIVLVSPLFFYAVLEAQTHRQVHDEWTYTGNYIWNPSWNNRPYPRAGACFFKNAGFDGDHFCVRSGDRLDHLPGSFGDDISSIKLLGRGGVVIFNDRHFSGGSQEVHKSIQDLRNRRFEDGHTWNNRISSIIVR
jgi:hypothetical protein